MSSYLSKHELILLKKLNYLRKFLNFDFLFQQYQTSIEISRKYYRATRIPFYRIFCSRKGFMHIGLSFNGKYEKDKKYEYVQAQIVAKYLKNLSSGNIVEIGCGQGANLQYLGTRFPNLNFTGIDLIPGSKLNWKTPTNITFMKDDYHLLSKIPDNSIDLIFAIETLCYSTNKEKLFHVLYQKLKPNGKIIVFDGYSCKTRDQYSQVERICLDVLENAYHIDSFEYLGDVERAMGKNNFSLILSKNLDLYAEPYFSEIEKRIEKYCLLGTLLKLVLKCLPSEITGSMVPGYILGEMVRSKLVSYNLHILKKETINEI